MAAREGWRLPPELQHFRIPDYHSLTSVFNSCLAKHSLISIRPPRRAARLDLMASRIVDPILPLEFIPKCKVSSLIQCMLLSYLNFLGCGVLVRGPTCPC